MTAWTRRTVLSGLVLYESAAAAGAHALGTMVARYTDTKRAIILQTMVVVAGSTIKFVVKYTREGSLRHITKIHRGTENRSLSCP